jgi:hypothetical protein
MAIELRNNGFTDKDILKNLRVYFCEYNASGNKNDLDKADKIADLMDLIDYHKL